MVVYSNIIAYIERFVNVANHALLWKFSELKVVIVKRNITFLMSDNSASWPPVFTPYLIALSYAPIIISQ
jgi:hypothetical protein